jgi:uncharacterized damage-inducible protein DinB
MSKGQSLIHELEMEAATTRRVLERVPGDKLSWKPHQKSMSLGQLALHVAATPGNVVNIVAPDVCPPPESFEQAPAESADELLPALDASVGQAKAYLSELSDEAAMATWKLAAGDKVLMEAPRIGLIRSLMFNHWYHHRGQLSVYLRELDVPVPSIYGPSADENPFAM